MHEQQATDGAVIYIVFVPVTNRCKQWMHAHLRCVDTLHSVQVIIMDMSNQKHSTYVWNRTDCVFVAFPGVYKTLQCSHHFLTHLLVSKRRTNLLIHCSTN